MKKKMLLLLLVIVFFLGLTISLTGANAAVEDELGDLIFYEKDGAIWEVSIVSGLKWKIIDHGYFPKLSKDGLKLAYYNKNMKPAVYDLATETSTVISKTAVPTANMQPTWSISGKYLVVNGHTSTNNMFSVINMNGKEKVSFFAVGDVYWINDNELVYTSLHNVDTPRPRGDGGGDAFGVSKINVKTGKATILLTPNQMIDYQLFDVKDGKIRLTKFVATMQADWESDNLEMTYWRMNKKGKNLQKTSKIVAWDDKIADALPKAYKNYLVDDFGAYQNTNWRIFTLRKNFDSDSVIYIMYYPYKEALNKIAKGDFPSW